MIVLHVELKKNKEGKEILVGDISFNNHDHKLYYEVPYPKDLLSDDMEPKLRLSGLVSVLSEVNATFLENLIFELKNAYLAIKRNRLKSLDITFEGIEMKH